MPTRTDKVPNTSATAASAGTDLNGAAVADACAQIRARLAAVAAGLLDCEPADVRFDDGIVSARGTIDRRSATLCEAAYQQRVPLFAQGFYRTPDIHFDPRPARGKPFHYFAFGAAVSEVEVDGFTGALPAAAHRHPAGRRRLDLADRRSRPDRRRLHPGRRLADARRAALGRARAASPPAARPPTSCRRGRRCPRSSNVDFLERATQPGVVMRQQGGRRAAADAGDLGARSAPRRRRRVRRRRRGHLRQPGHARARLLRSAARRPSGIVFAVRRAAADRDARRAQRRRPRPLRRGDRLGLRALAVGGASAPGPRGRSPTLDASARRR